MNLWRNHFSAREQLILCFLVIVGVTLRVVNAIKTQLWRDEVYVFFTSRDNSLLDLLLQRHWDKLHPPLYFIFLHYWQKIAITPFFLRLPSIGISFFTLILIPVLAKKLFPRLRYFPVLALFFYAISHTQISLNMVVRPYPFVIFFMTLSIIFFLDIIKSKALPIKKAFHFAVINFLVFFSDYSGVWLLISYYVFWVIYYLFLARKEVIGRKSLLVSLILTLLISQIWLPIFFKNLPYSLSFEGKLIQPFFKNTNPIKANYWQLPFFSGTTATDLPIMLNLLDHIYWSFLVIFIALLGAIIAFLKTKKNGLFLLVIFLSPLVFSFTFSIFFKPIFLARNLNLVNFALILGLAYSTSMLFKKILGLAILILIIWSINFLSAFPKLHYVDPPYDWIKLAKILSSFDKNQTVNLITNDPNYMFTPLRYYLLFHHSPKIRLASLEQAKTLNGQNSKIIFIKTSKSEVNPNINQYPEFYKIAQLINCEVQQEEIDYIFFAKCKK